MGLTVCPAHGLASSVKKKQPEAETLAPNPL